MRTLCVPLRKRSTEYGKELHKREARKLSLILPRKEKIPRLANPQMTSACAFSKQSIIDNIEARSGSAWADADSNSTKPIRMMDWAPEVGPFCLDTFIPEALTLMEAPLVLCYGEVRRLACHLDSSNTLPSKVLLIRRKESQRFWR